jgi:hypothetical protein
VRLADVLPQAVEAPALGLEGGGGPTIPCRVAVVVMASAQSRANRLNNIMLVLVGIALLAIVGAIVVFLVADGATAEALITFVGGLLTGTLAKFIKDEREDATADRDAAHTILNTQCAGQSADEVLAAMGL